MNWVRLFAQGDSEHLSVAMAPNRGRTLGKRRYGWFVPARRNGETIQRQLWLVALSVPAVLLAAAVYELALALGLVGSYAGLAPGQGIEGEDTVAAVASLTMLVGAVIASVHAIRPRWPWALAIFAPAAAAFMTTRFYTYDPYYLPTLRRYSDGGAVPAAWILSMLAVSLVVGVSSHLQPRAGSKATAFMLPLVLLTSVFASDGH
jgi:hypothetical protein